VFSEAQLASLYPTPKAFLSAYKRALKRSTRAGWILQRDAKLMRRWAAESGIGG
jgi:hypothetical protein